ncbi:penicillin-binding protein [Lactobacillus gallinarum]|uniref:Penicillin-binding protein n=1 Tax=Lactobacillus gallinarum TaxID=52242 RepID=A0A1Y4W7S2_9LACO|nr:penicillin-binding protein [Lactobacillus gallinarum]OUQ00538.1 penicillin-binding protein [Lactobacillus gallinarum]OUQ48799.1 penicillin-binding protein [Lactobacillus gallinarum]OUQ57797.1 penicillin-binding protein [Lactobacillus gallinarum]OUQ77653.1 penicillin-binding protein [Lactobacillus gallinarum]
MKKNSNLKLQKSKAHSYRFTVGRVLQVAVALVFLVFTARFLYIGISKTVNGQNLSARTKQLYKRNQVIKATRGTIYDRNGLAIAEDSHLYTIYAILDKSSINYKNKPEYVVNKSETAEKLATVLPMSADKIYRYLNPKQKAFQVQFGTAGSGLTSKQKKKIEAMKLPGIKFLATPSRLYPNGNFASHIVGLAQPVYDKKTNAQNLVGTMGIEAYFNKTLTGTDGYRISSVDASEYQMPNGNQVYKPVKNGNNLYLTLDSQLQSYLESHMTDVQKAYDPTSITAVVEDMKTGKILAASQRPTFNPQTKKGLTKAYRNILVQDTYEPGSAFKVLSFAAVVNSGNYNPNEYFRSGSVNVGGSTIHDWLTSGWGTIPFSQAFEHSSNTGFVKLEQKMGAKTWNKYLKKFHIGQKTGITLPGEQPGFISFKTPVDQAVTAFGQGVTVNVMQMMQAYSSLANNGQMVKPQLVDKITDSNGKTLKGYEIKKVGSKIYSNKTKKVVLANMKRVLNKQSGTGNAYKMGNADIAVKTGTAQIANPKGGGYLKGDSNYIFSVVGVYPTKDPRYCIYLTIKQPHLAGTTAEKILASIFKPMMSRIITMAKSDNSTTTVSVPNFKNMTVAQASAKAKQVGLNLVKVGEKDRITAQGIKSSEKLESGDKIFVYTSGKINCPDMKGWSFNDLHQFSNVSGIKLSIKGTGTVTSQSVAKGAELKSGEKIKVNLKE